MTCFVCGLYSRRVFCPRAGTSAVSGDNEADPRLQTVSHYETQLKQEEDKSSTLFLTDDHQFCLLTGQLQLAS